MRYKHCKRWAALILTLSVLLAVGASAAASGAVIGQVGSFAPSNVGEGSLCDDSGLGAAVADAARAAACVDVAVMNGGDLAGNLRPGEVTWEELLFLFTEDRPLVTASVSVEQLYTLLEFCLSRMCVDPVSLRMDEEASAFAAFPQLSGCTLRYDISAPVGERIVSLTLDSGEALARDDTRTLRIVCTDYLLVGGYGGYGEPIDAEPLGLTACEALARYVADGSMGDYTEAERVKRVGSADVTIASELGLNGLLILLVAIGAFIMGAKYRGKERRSLFDRPSNEFHTIPE